MVNDSLSLSHSSNLQLHIGLELEQAKSEAKCTIIRTSSNRKQREVKANITTVAILIATIAFGILAKVVSPFFALPAIGFTIWNGVQRSRAFKVMNFTEQEEKERSYVWRRVELLSDLALWAQGQASLNDEWNFRKHITPQFNRFLNCIFKRQDTAIQDSPTVLEPIPDVSLSLPQLITIYSIFKDIAIYRHLEEVRLKNLPLDDEVANTVAKSMGCSCEQILARLPQIPNITDVYERMAQQIIIETQQITPNEVNSFSLVKMCQEFPSIPLFFSGGDRSEAALTLL